MNQMLISNMHLENFYNCQQQKNRKQRSRKLFINTNSGQFMMDNSGITLQSSESIFIDTSR